MRNPHLYLYDNVVNALNLVQAAADNGVRKFVLLSTANLFGTHDRMPIDENTDINPGSPYGESKFMIERILHWADEAHGVRSACLRSFNAAGTRPDDLSVLIASSERVRKDLGWSPRFPDLETIIRHAWDWRCRNPEGYASPVTRELVSAS